MPHHAAAGLNSLLARTDIDAVIVALPITIQPAVVRHCWKAGKHVLSEKPISQDIATASDLIREYEANYAPRGIVWRIAEVSLCSVAS